MLARPLMFLSAYSPLFAILAVRFDTEWLRTAMVLATIAGTGSLVLIFRVNRGKEPASRDLTEVREAGPEAASFLAAYLLPFVTVSSPTVPDVIGYAIFLIVAAAIHMRSSVIQINPLLYVFGFHVYWTVDSHGAGRYLVSHRPVSAGDTVRASVLGDNVTVHRPKAV